MTTFHFQTHVSESGVITLPPLPATFYGEDVTVNVDVRLKPKREISLDELCGAWGNEEDRDDVDRMVAAIHEGRIIGQEKDKQSTQERKRAFEELCDAWCADERSTEEIIRDIYESRTIGRERDPL